MVQQLQPTSVKPAEGSSQQGWEEQEACPGSPVPLQDRLHSLAEAERLLDELTQEKMQVGRVQCEPNHITRHSCVQHGMQGFPAVMFNDGGLSSSLTIQNDWWIPVCRADRGSSEPAAQRRRQSESTGQVRRGEILFYVRNVNRSRAGV